MDKKRGFNYKENRALLKKTDRNLDNEELLKELKLKNLDMFKMKEYLERCCYALRDFGVTNLREFRRDIKNMDDKEIKVVEKVNEMSIEKVIEELDEMIYEHERVSKIKKEYKTKITEKVEEIKKEMVEKGEVIFSEIGFTRFDEGKLQEKGAEDFKRIRDEIRKKYKIDDE